MTVHLSVISGTFPNGDWQCGFYTDTTLGTLPDLQTRLYTAAHNMFGPEGGGATGYLATSNSTIKATLITSYTISTFEFRKTAVQTTVVNIPGFLADKTLPVQCSPVLTLLASGSPRPNLSRMFLPPIASTQLVSGLLPGAIRTTLLGYFKTGLNYLATNGYIPVAFDRQTLEHHPITQIRMANVVGSRTERAHSIPVDYQFVNL
jgi:hypothetical protein